MHYDFYSFFTKYSMLESYGFLPGLWARVVRKFIPEVANENQFEFLIKRYCATADDFAEIHPTLLQMLADPDGRQDIKEGLDAALSALTTKVIAFGLDQQLQAKFTALDISTAVYQQLIHALDRLITNGKSSITDFRSTLDGVQLTITQLRQRKHEIGTSLHLTVSTKRILEYISRIQLLLDLKDDLDNLGRWDILIRSHLEHARGRNSIRRYLKDHTDKLALVIVEHTSQQGESYVADNFAQYRAFFKKGLLGGLLIAVFALFKIYLDKYYDAPLASALLFSLNYASCFVLVKLIGGTIATKQPAMTASTIIKHIDQQYEMRLGEQRDVIQLLRKVWRSQFVSLAGNFLMAFSISCLLAAGLRLGWIYNPIDAAKSEYLFKSVSLIKGGAIFYAAIAGIFLALTGFVAGYFDNRVIASRLPHRLRHHWLLERFTSPVFRDRLASFVEVKTGGLLGNITLGFFLGCAFLLSYLLPFSVDIRHVAFSSANVGYATVGQAVSWSVVGLALLQVLTIGLVNFLVSFSLTFFLALKSRGVTTRGLSKLFMASLKDFVFHPLEYLIYRRRKPPVEGVERV